MQEPSRRKQDERSGAMRARLVRAARDLFADRGFADTATPDIVAAAGVTRGALYHHFADKTDLFRAVVAAEAAEVAASVRSGTEESAGADPLGQGSAAWFAAMAAPGRVRILLRDGPAVLGLSELARIDRVTGGATLRDGLAASGADGDALADILSAAFDRAALAIDDGADPGPYRASLDRVLRVVLADTGDPRPAG